MSNDIYKILQKFDEAETPKQLPALFKPKNISPVLGADKDKKDPMDGYLVGEDIISTVKKKLGDYLSNIEDEIKKDPGLIKQELSQIDQPGPAVKTITTDDGNEIKIHGNEDDGFRITIKNKPSTAHFENLDHAVMACEMFCNRRRTQNLNADYVEEKSNI